VRGKERSASRMSPTNGKGRTEKRPRNRKFSFKVRGPLRPAPGGCGKSLQNEKRHMGNAPQERTRLDNARPLTTHQEETACADFGTIREEDIKLCGGGHWGGGTKRWKVLPHSKSKKWGLTARARKVYLGASDHTQHHVLASRASKDKMHCNTFEIRGKVGEIERRIGASD